MAEPLSFWGGIDASTGRVIDRHHPRTGESVSGRVLVMPAGRGSSSSSSVLAEAIRVGTGPAGIVLSEVDEIVALGAIVARELYDRVCPIVVLDAGTFGDIPDRTEIAIEAPVEGPARVYVTGAS
jgi:predicted aconitase with swiveling domain